MAAVARCQSRVPSPQLRHFSLLAPADMLAAVGDGVAIANLEHVQHSALPSIREDHSAAAARTTAALARLHAAHVHQNTLCVAHGFTVEHFGKIVRPTQYMPNAQYCGFVVAKGSTRQYVLADRVPIAVPTECCTS